MPIYDFICSKCGKKITRVQSFYSPFPECCNEEMQKEFGSIAYYVMKGDRSGSTPGNRLRAKELHKKSIKNLEE